jgi:hypothetical protein
LLRDFQRRAHNFLAAQHLPAAEMVGEWLALMQHFGAPTRLLDFTRSPYVAAYFAFEDPPPEKAAEEPPPECAIWAVNTRWCLRNFGGFAAAQHGLFGLTEAAMTSLVGSLPPPALFQRLVLGSAAKSQLERHALSHINNAVCEFEPFRISERMAAQQGTFLWTGDINQTVQENFAAYGDWNEGVGLLTMPLTQRNRALGQLRRMNITRASLFPGLDGFAQSFRNALVKESPEEIAQRLRLQHYGIGKPT